MDPKLHMAAADGNIHALQVFDDIPVQLTPKGKTVLHIAAQFGQAEFFKKILIDQLSSPSSLLQQRIAKGGTPLHLAAREGHLTVVKNLVAAGKQLRGDTEGGGKAVCKVMMRKKTALHEAVRYHHPEVVKLLIQEDSELINGANSEGNTPLYIAAERGFGNSTQLLFTSSQGYQRSNSFACCRNEI